MSGVAGRPGPLERARDALDSGARWRARDILEQHVGGQGDPEALALLGDVLFDMGDLPRAGVAWFSAGRRGPAVDEAVAAWREQSGDDFLVMWRSLPPSVRAEPRPPRVEALHARAADSAGGDPDDADDAEVADNAKDADGGGVDAAQVISWLLAAVFVACAVIGAVTALGWVVPG
ncbi:MAG: hypothetical protein ACRCYX_07605 [Dermatophilaceae bacterium]